MANVATMIELASEQLWEQLNQPRVDEELLRDASFSLDDAVNKMESALDSINDAVFLLKDTLAEDKVASLLNDIEDKLADLRVMKYNFRKGVF